MFNDNNNNNEERTALSSPTLCVNCKESNKPEAKFCFKCGMVLRFEAYSETIAESIHLKKRLETIEKMMASMVKVFITKQNETVGILMQDASETNKIMEALAKIG